MSRSPGFATLLLATTSLVAPALAQVTPGTLPTGGRVASGAVAIGTPAGNRLVIQQGSQNAIVNWQGFSVGSAAQVQIQQPNSQAAILNRVTGNAPSTIAGQVNANGQVYLVNPNGIAITKTSTVNAGAFVASTLGVSDEDFRNGRRQFSGANPAAVSNAGAITIGRGGYAALLGGKVSNSGTITVPMGKIGLGAGQQATLDLSGDGFLQVAVPSTGKGALVSNSGTLSAEGGLVQLSAATARDAVRHAVNMSGVIEATGVSGQSGAIVLSGGDGGSVSITGRLDASSAAGTGGTVTVTGRSIGLRGATVNASGALGGGQVQVGGGRQGGGPLPHADRVRVDAATTINADATRQGSGGNVVVWSDRSTKFAGTISAKGGPAGGDGGQAEVSSKGTLAYTGTTDLRASAGQWGTLLLDPYNVTISSGASSNQAGFTATGNDSVINATTLVTALGTANVTVSTGSSGSQAGNITLAAPLTWTTGATLTLQAAGAIQLNDGIVAQAGGLTLGAGSTLGAIDQVTVARFTLTSGDWVQNMSVLPGFAAADFQIQGGSFLRATGGNGNAGNPYTLADIYGVQGIGSSATLLAASFQLARDVDASPATTWNSGAGFSPIGGVTSFTGNFDGAGHTITGLTINQPSTNSLGLFATIGSGGTVSNLGMVGGSITGASAVGMLAATNQGTITNAYATGNVSGANYAGGLVGANDGGIIVQSYASGTVNGSVSAAGGLAGYNNFSISQSYATGTVNGNNLVGGLVGANQGTVTTSYATGAATGSYAVGGLVGFNSGSISLAYALGAVSSNADPGGFVGYNSGSISQAYSTGAVSGTYLVGAFASTNVGTLTNNFWDMGTAGSSLPGVVGGSASGVTGLSTAAARQSSSYTSFDFTNDWYQAGDMRPILRGEVAGVSGVIPISNIHQLQLVDTNLAGSYVLTGNIDASATAGSNPAGIFGPGGFVPIGSNTAFSGSFNGAGYTVSGLTINQPPSFAGLFSTLSTGGTIGNLGLVGVNVAGGSFVGGLVGLNSGGAISQSYVTGTVGGSAGVGGLVGGNLGGSVTQSYVTAAVNGGIDTGGLVGANTGSISQSYATGAVTGTANVGGLVGTNVGGATISQSYATGSVSGTGTVGGLVGNNNDSIDQVYASGAVSSSRSADNYIGGLVGVQSGSPPTSATLSNAYWDTSTTGQSVAVGSDTGATTTTLGLTTAQARTGGSYSRFDLSTVWYQSGDLRPILRSEAATAVNGIIPVSNLHQLQLMDANPYGIYQLASNISATETNGSNTSGVFGPGGFVPIAQNAAFYGMLNGNGHTINNLTINQPSGSYVGLFGYLCSCTVVTNVGLVGGSITGYAYVGALAGASESTISQSYATASVSGATYVGGLIGYTIHDSSVPTSGSVTQSYATGSVTGTTPGSGTLGGLVGFASPGSAIMQSHATGAVSGGDTVGGLVGIAQRSAIAQSYATGAASGTTAVGGLVGILQGSTITQSYATGAMLDSGGTAAVGGLVGYSYPSGGTTSSITQSYAMGTVTGFGAGGLVGVAARTTISQSYATGLVTGATYAGGLVSFDNGANTVTSSFWDVTATGQATSAVGGTGLTTAQMQDLSSYTTNYAGFDFANVWAPPNQIGQNNGSATAYYPQLYALSTVLAVTPANTSRLYGAANPALATSTTYAGLQAGDFVTTLGSVATTATTTSNVGNYGVAASGSAVTSTAGNSYRVVYAPGTLAVTPAPLNVTADNQTKAYGQVNPTLTATVLGVLNGDNVPVTLSTTAGQYSGVNNYAITLASVGNGNYSTSVAGGSFTAGSLAVTPAPLTITANTQTKVYGQGNPTLTYSISSGTLVNGDMLSGGLASGVTTATGIGSYAITQGALAASANYALSYVPANLTVTTRPITVTADAQGRVYGNANPALTYVVGGSGLVNGDTLSGGLVTSATATSSVGSYGITQGGLTASANYSLTYAGANLTVTARPITVTADAQSRIYGDANPALTYTIGGGGLVNGDVLAGSLVTAGTTASSVAGGPYAITQGSLAASSNYALTYVGASLTVAARPITVTANAQSRVYGDANPTLTYAVGGSGLVNGDALSGSLVTSATTTSSVAGSPYAITQGSLAAGSNYALTYAGANLTVTARPITVIADAQSRVYGDANPALTYAVGGSGLVNGDALSGGLATLATTTSSVAGGPYAITQGSLAAGGNYALTYAGANLTVTARPITVTADAQSRIYGDANPTLTYAVGGSGLVNGDALSGGLATSATATSSVAGGPYAITQGSLAAGSNYALTYAGANLTVTSRPITVTADAQSRIYGDANPTLTYAVGGSGLVNGDTLSGSLATSATATSGVAGGPYAITQGSLAAGGNYALTYGGANLTVTVRPITVTADAQSRVYGDANPTLAYAVGGGGLVNGDALSGTLATSASIASSVNSYSITQGSLTTSSNYGLTYVPANLAVTARPVTVTADAQSRIYGDTNPVLTYAVGGSGLVNGDTFSGALATTATAASNAGSYAVTQGALAASANYTLTYVSANLMVTTRPVTVTADAQSRLYGNPNPTLTYAVGGSGLVNGDALSGGLATAATVGSNVGSYGITQGSLAASNNYALTYVPANLMVTTRPITVNADAQTRAYGNVNPALTYTVGGGGLMNGDTLSGALATTATAATNIGAYGITQGSIAASGNYALTYLPANLLVTARPLTVTADAQSRAYGNANPILTYAVGGSGLVNGDALSGGLATIATTTSNVGAYGITQGSIAASSNYALTYLPGNLLVTGRPITITADAQSRVYGNANPTLTYTMGGSGLVNGDALSGGLATAATTASNVGGYGITQGSVAASGNYSLTYVPANLMVTARPITVTADAQTRAYGNANPALTYAVGGSGLVNGDTVSGGLATVATVASNVGGYSITQGSLAASGNYALTYLPANLLVTVRPITVTADAQSRVYGNANPTLTYAVSGLVNGDALSGGLVTTATTASNVGSYGITQGSVAASGNYTLTYAPSNLIVTARPIMVTADAQSRVYGNANPTLTYAVSGLVNGDALSGGLVTTATTASNVGSYGITQGSVAASGNYTLTYAPSNLIVTARPITVTADAQSRVYGNANPALTYAVGGNGLVNGDALQGALATTATAASNLGSYGITQGSVAASSNYALIYLPANLTVTKRPITVTADPESRAFGNANPPLTYTIGGSGLVNGDVLGGTLATLAAATSPAGAYAITQGSLTASSNYALSYIGASLVVTAAPPTLVTDTSDVNQTGSTVDRHWQFMEPQPVTYTMPLSAWPQPGATQTLLDDPRFDGALVCLGGTGASCVSAHP